MGDRVLRRVDAIQPTGGTQDVPTTALNLARFAVWGIINNPQWMLHHIPHWPLPDFTGPVILVLFSAPSPRDHAVAGAAIVTDSHQGLYMDSDHEYQVILHDFWSAAYKAENIHSTIIFLLLEHNTFLYGILFYGINIHYEFLTFWLALRPLSRFKDSYGRMITMFFVHH